VAERTYTTYRVRTKRRHWRSVALVLAILVGALVGSAAWLSRDESGHIPPGIEIAGVDVGGMSLADARSAVEGRAAQLAAEPVALGFEGGRLQTSGEELGAQADIAAVLARAEDSRDRVSRLKARLGFADPITFDLSFTVDPERLDVVLKRLAKRIEQPPVPARVAFVDGEVVTRPARAGSQLDLEKAAAALSTLPDHVQLTMQDVQPRIGDEAAAEAKAAAETLLAGTPTLFYKDTRYDLPVAVVGDALRFKPKAGAIEVSLDRDRLEGPLRGAFGEFESVPQNATFEVDGDRVTVVPARRGIVLAVGRIAAAITAAPSAPELRALFNDAKPELTTVGAQKLHIRQLVSEFTTPYPCCASRVTNIQRAAQILDGYVIQPGARFSLNDALGERTVERGFVSAPMIAAGGRLEDAIGGGVSQVATTFYNAAFFAGLELIEHTPHSFYISRYPMGREATVSWGGPELIFRNDWPVGILVKVTALDTSITVRFYSSKLRRRVETETSEPYNYVAATTLRELNPSLPPGSESVVQGGGVSGFTVDYTRRVYRGKKLIKDEHYAVRYDPENTLIEYGPEPPAPTAQDSGGGTPSEGNTDSAGSSGGGPPQEEPPAESGGTPD
jgi:vancomycin resistance protein YoaR